MYINCRFICWNTFLWNLVTSTNIIPTTNVYPKDQRKVCAWIVAEGSCDTLPYSLPWPYAIMFRSGGNNTMHATCSHRLFVSWIHIFVFHLLQHIQGIDRWNMLLKESKTVGWPIWPHTVKKINSPIGKTSTRINHLVNTCLFIMSNSHFWKADSSSSDPHLAWLK